jgi:hypothetical protein
MSGATLRSNPNSMVQFKDGYQTAVDTLTKPIKPFRFGDVAGPYYNNQPPTSTAVNDFRSKIVAAELMIRAGANVVTVQDSAGNGDLPWDSHGDGDGTRVRNMMTQRVLPALNIFLNRITTDGELSKMNIVVTIFGDFARSRPNSDHASGVAATVIGKYVNVGTAGRMDSNVGLPTSVGAGAQYWNYLAQALKMRALPFGNASYTSLIKATKGWG